MPAAQCQPAGLASWPGLGGQPARAPLLASPWDCGCEHHYAADGLCPAGGIDGAPAVRGSHKFNAKLR